MYEAVLLSVVHLQLSTRGQTQRLLCYCHCRRLCNIFHICNLHVGLPQQRYGLPPLHRKPSNRQHQSGHERSKASMESKHAESFRQAIHGGSSPDLFKVHVLFLYNFPFSNLVLFLQMKLLYVHKINNYLNNVFIASGFIPTSRDCSVSRRKCGGGVPGLRQLPMMMSAQLIQRTILNWNRLWWGPLRRLLSS